MEKANPFDHTIKEVTVGEKTYKYYSLNALKD